MKKYIILTATGIIFLMSCNKKDDTKKEDVMGTVSCIYNGVSWKANAGAGGSHARKQSFFDIEFLNPHNNVRSESIYFFNIRTISEKQYIHKRSPLDTVLGGIYLTSDLEDDVSCDSYEIVESDSLNNWIQITEEKNNYGEIWGSFSATFVKVHGCNGSPYPDTVRIRNGTFHIWDFNYY